LDADTWTPILSEDVHFDLHIHDDVGEIENARAAMHRWKRSGASVRLIGPGGSIRRLVAIAVLVVVRGRRGLGLRLRLGSVVVRWRGWRSHGARGIRRVGWGKRIARCAARTSRAVVSLGALRETRLRGRERERKRKSTEQPETGPGHPRLHDLASMTPFGAIIALSRSGGDMDEQDDDGRIEIVK
jgi:hypothetical protein